jgi:hypothetical protein
LRAGAENRPELTVGSAVDTAIAVAREHGLRVDEPRVLSESNNVVVALDPAPVIARVTLILGALRPNGGGEAMRNEVEMAAHVHRKGGPVVPPSAELPPGPHRRDGHWVSFWERADGESRASAAEAAPILRELHEAIADFDGELRPMATVLDDVPVVTAEAERTGGIDAAGADLMRRSLARLEPVLLEPGLPVRPLHGDPHVGNLLVHDGRPAWTDFEDCGLGPVQWDLVCLLRARGEVDARELAAYGEDVDPASLAPFVAAGMIRGAAWLSLLAVSDPGYARDRDERLSWLAAREREAEAS